jgi:hypothetical protein
MDLLSAEVREGRGKEDLDLEQEVGVVPEQQLW